MTPIQFFCTGCQTKLKVSNPALAGKKMKCPKCGAIVVAPAAPPEAEMDDVVMASVAPEPRPAPRKSFSDEVEPAPRARPRADFDDGDSNPPPLRPRHRGDDQDYDEDDRDEPRHRAQPPAKRGLAVPIAAGVICLLYLGALVAVFLGLADSLLLGDISLRQPVNNQGR